MWTLSGFADEIDPDFETQCAHVAGLGLTAIELRSAWGVNSLLLDDDQRAEAKRILAEHGLTVSSIGSPVGKIRITEDFEPHLDWMRRALDVAAYFGAPYIRMFSFFIDEGDDPDRHRDEVLRRMKALVELAHGHDVTLLHENEKEIYGDIPRRCLDLVTTIDDPQFRLTWDPANFVQVGVAAPFDEGYADLRPHVVYLQIKDALLADASVVPAGEGDGQVRETIRALKAVGFDGYCSLEPHLVELNEFGAGLGDGQAEWTRAHAAFTALLDAEGIPYA